MSRNTRGADPETCLLHAMQVAGQLRKNGPKSLLCHGSFPCRKIHGAEPGCHQGQIRQHPAGSAPDGQRLALKRLRRCRRP